MGFSLSDLDPTKIVKKGLKEFDKATLGIMTLGLTDGTFASDMLTKAGLKPGDVPNLANAADNAHAREMIELARIEKEKRNEAKFMGKEGQGLSRKGVLSFGDASRTTAASDLAATGRFTSNRLVL